jgi:hypothetical protein
MVIISGRHFNNSESGCFIAFSIISVICIPVCFSKTLLAPVFQIRDILSRITGSGYVRKKYGSRSGFSQIRTGTLFVMLQQEQDQE